MNPQKKHPVMEEINAAVMGFNGRKDMNIEPNLHIGLNPLFIQMRHEVYNLGGINLQVRRSKLKQLFIDDFLQEDKELRLVGYAFINTQP